MISFLINKNFNIRLIIYKIFNISLNKILITLMKKILVIPISHSINNIKPIFFTKLSLKDSKTFQNCLSDNFIRS